MKSRKFIVTIIFLYLLIWGPIDHSVQGWLMIRILYLIVIPLFTWFILKWLWKFWNPDKKSERRLENILAFLTGIFFCVMVFCELLADTHIGNNLWLPTFDGMEPVGDEVVMKGPNWGAIIILSLGAYLSFWFVYKNNDN